MKKIIFAFVALLALSCNEDKGLKQLDFYQSSLSVPDYLIVDKSKNGSDFCEDDVVLKNEDEDTSVSFKLCNYTFGKRPNFNLLKKYFNESSDILKEEKPELSFIDKKYNEKGAYYEFIYQYEIDKKVYYINSLAYEDYYVVVRISSKSKTQVNELVETLDVMISDKVFSNNIASNKKEKACLSCNFPDSW